MCYIRSIIHFEKIHRPFYTGDYHKKSNLKYR